MRIMIGPLMPIMITPGVAMKIILIMNWNSKIILVAEEISH